MITSYSFGSMEIQGRTCSQDVIIFPDGRIHTPWWRKQGHRLAADDLTSLLETGPEIIVIGTGASGLMQVPADVREQLDRLGIETIIRRTSAAVEEFNRLNDRHRTGGCFHLTC